MPLSDFITAMPKVELHVHLQGATQPETMLELARRNNVSLPANTIDEMREWYTFRSFRQFIDIYIQICRCIETEDDLEWMAREFLKGQAAQNIIYSEVTYTPAVRNHRAGLTFDRQLEAINRAIAWAQADLGVSMSLVIDIPREVSLKDAEMYADWALEGWGNGVVAFGLGGYEPGNPPEKYARQFARVRAAGMPCVPHAGETVGAESIWSALRVCDAVRIGHGVRCLEDSALVSELRQRQIPLEVSPTSNVCLGVFPSLAEHSLPRLLDAGLYVTLNSDDPPMFNTTLTDEYMRCAETFNWDVNTVEKLIYNALDASFLPRDTQQTMRSDFEAKLAELRERYVSTPEVG